jgi:hypothetical protein
LGVSEGDPLVLSLGALSSDSESESRVVIDWLRGLAVLLLEPSFVRERAERGVSSLGVEILGERLLLSVAYLCDGLSAPFDGVVGSTGDESAEPLRGDDGDRGDDDDGS